MVELLITVAVVLVAAAALPTAYRNFIPGDEADRFAPEVASWLRQVAERASAGWHFTNHGLYVDTSSRRLILYRGASFAARDPAGDETLPWPATVSLTTTGPAGADFNFAAATGLPAAAGTITVASAARTVCVDLNSWGGIVLGSCGL